MPRDGSGNYTLPAGSTAVSGATISSTNFNTMTNDMASALTGSVPRDGSGSITGPLKEVDGSASAPAYAFTSSPSSGVYKTTNGVGIAVGGALIAEVTASGILNGSSVPYQVTPTISWTNVASATTTNIGASGSSNLQITGTTTITSFGTVASGTTIQLRFSAALTLTYNATSLILPTASNITTAANDTATAISLGSGNWVVVNYTRANGTPLSFTGAVTSLTAGSGLSAAPSPAPELLRSTPTIRLALARWRFFRMDRAEQLPTAVPRRALT